MERGIALRDHERPGFLSQRRLADEHRATVPAGGVDEQAEGLLQHPVRSRPRHEQRAARPDRKLPGLHGRQQLPDRGMVHERDGVQPPDPAQGGRRRCRRPDLHRRRRVGETDVGRVLGPRRDQRRAPVLPPVPGPRGRGGRVLRGRHQLRGRDAVARPRDSGRRGRHVPVSGGAIHRHVDRGVEHHRLPGPRGEQRQLLVSKCLLHDEPLDGVQPPSDERRRYLLLPHPHLRGGQRRHQRGLVQHAGLGLCPAAGRGAWLRGEHVL